MFDDSIAALIAIKFRGSLDCKYVLTYGFDPIEYFNDDFELEYFLNIHEIEHGVAFEDDPIHGPIPYYTFSDSNYHIVDLLEEKECRIYYSLD